MHALHAADELDGKAPAKSVARQRYRIGLQARSGLAVRGPFVLRAQAPEIERASASMARLGKTASKCRAITTGQSLAPRTS